MLVVANSPAKYVLVKGRQWYVFTPHAEFPDMMRCRVIHPDRRLNIDCIVSVSEARTTWAYLTKRGFRRW